MNLFLQIVIICIIGTSLSYFATRIAWRLFFTSKIKGKKINLFSKSICLKCGYNLSIIDIIPIFSFLKLRGKCRYCNGKISILYLMAEIFIPINFMLATYFFGGINIQSLLLCAIIFCLTIQSIIDIRVMMSSDVIHIIEFILCILLAKLIGITNIQIILMIVFTFVFFMFIGLSMKYIKKQDSLGFGDIKLFMILSCLFNFREFVWFITLSGLCGVLFFYIKKLFINSDENIFPFIPSIFIAFLFAFYYKMYILY